MVAWPLFLHVACICSPLIFWFKSDSCIPAILLRLPAPPHNGQARDEESCSCGTSQEGHEGDEGKEGIKVNACAEEGLFQFLTTVLDSSLNSEDLYIDTKLRDGRD